MGNSSGLLHGSLPVTVVFPMAGQGARFGYRFKPFLTFKNQLFIEAAVRPFLPFREQIAKLVFAYLEEQESAFSVRAQLAEVLPGTEFVCACFPCRREGRQRPWPEPLPRHN